MLSLFVPLFFLRLFVPYLSFAGKLCLSLKMALFSYSKIEISVVFFFYIFYPFVYFDPVQHKRKKTFDSLMLSS